MLLFVASSLLYPYVATVGFIALVRAVQGGLFSVITMTTGSTLVIDVTASRRRTDANIAFSPGWGVLEWWQVLRWEFTFILTGIFTMLFIPVSLWAALALLLILAVDVPFRAPLQHLMVLVGPFSVASYSVAGH